MDNLKVTTDEPVNDRANHLNVTIDGQVHDETQAKDPNVTAENPEHEKAQAGNPIVTTYDPKHDKARADNPNVTTADSEHDKAQADNPNMTAEDLAKPLVHFYKKEPLETLVKDMESVFDTNWDHDHFNRALFCDIEELKGLPQDSKNCNPEHEHKNCTRPVVDVLIVGQVETVEIMDEQLWMGIKDETGSILVIDNEPALKCDDYYNLHSKWRDKEKGHKLLSAPTEDDECALNVSKARWLLARRRKEVSQGAKIVPEMGDTLMIVGKIAEKRRQPCLYVIGRAVINEKQAEWIKKNREIGRWYENMFKEK